MRVAKSRVPASGAFLVARGLALLAHSAARYFAAARALLPNSRPPKSACSQSNGLISKQSHDNMGCSCVGVNCLVVFQKSFSFSIPSLNRLKFHSNSKRK